MKMKHLLTLILITTALFMACDGTQYPKRIIIDIITEEADETPPVVVSSYPEQGATDIDPEDLHDGIFVTFSEPVTGELDIYDVDNPDIWFALWFLNNLTGSPYEDNDTTAVFETTITFEYYVHLSEEPSYGTEYAIIGTVSDAAGNETEVHIPFSTTALE